MVIVTNFVISGFSWVDLAWLAVSTVRLQPTVWLHCPITIVQNDWWKIKQIVMVMIKEKIDDPWRGFLKYWDQILWNYFYTDYVRSKPRNG